MFINDVYGTGTDTKALYCDLDRLLSKHGQFLSQNNLLRDVEILKWMIERSIRGSVSATFYLRRHGERILTLIKEKMLIASMTTPNHYHLLAV